MSKAEKPAATPDRVTAPTAAELGVAGLRALMNRVDHDKPPRQADIDAVRALVTPAALRLIGDIVAQAERNLFDTMTATRSTQERFKAGAEVQRQLLGYATASAIEQLLIDAVVLAWLRYGMAEYQYTAVFTTEDGPTLARGLYWERRLTMTQKRYLKSLESLSRTRRLLHVRNVQINVAVAAAGGQQVNVAR